MSHVYYIYRGYMYPRRAFYPFARERGRLCRELALWVRRRFLQGVPCRGLLSSTVVTTAGHGGFKHTTDVCPLLFCLCPSNGNALVRVRARPPSIPTYSLLGAPLPSESRSPAFDSSRSPPLKWASLLFARLLPLHTASDENPIVVQVDADDDGGLLEQALAMSMMDGDEAENMRVRVRRRTWLAVAVAVETVWERTGDAPIQIPRGTHSLLCQCAFCRGVCLLGSACSACAAKVEAFEEECPDATCFFCFLQSWLCATNLSCGDAQDHGAALYEGHSCAIPCARLGRWCTFFVDPSCPS